MNAKIKLHPRNDAPTVVVSVPVPSGLDLHGFGLRWMQGESIRKLGRESGMEWNVLQGKLRILGYLRAPKRPEKGS
jgi:hypothetical protein